VEIFDVDSRGLIEERLGLRIRERIGVILKPDGGYEEHAMTDPNDWAVFYSCLTQYRFKEKTA